MKVNEENPLGSEKISRLLHDFALPSIIAMLVGALILLISFLLGAALGCTVMRLLMSLCR